MRDCWIGRHYKFLQCDHDRDLITQKRIALILSILLYPLIGNLLETMFWFFRAHFTVLPVLIVIPIFIIMGVMVPFVIYKFTAKKSIVERLRETE